MEKIAFIIFSLYRCGSFGNGMKATCDGLNAYGYGVHDCSSVLKKTQTAWFRN